jgi:oligogalacturonide transport system permease protein
VGCLYPLLFVGLLMLYPLVWMFSASFKPNHEIFTTLSLWPAHAIASAL